jgi:TolB-like protein
MMIRNIKKICGAVALLALLTAAAGSAAEVTKKVAVFPFQMNAAEDLSFLQEGIQDMLASRLAWEGKVEILEEHVVEQSLAGREGSLNEAAAREIGTALGADYVLFGSLTVFGQSVSIDARMVSLTGDSPPVSVYAHSKGMDEVIPRINEFAQSINNRIFGRGHAVAAKSAPQPRFSQAHPEKLMTGAGTSAGAAAAPAAPSYAPAAQGASSFEIMQPATTAAASDLWRSQKLSFPVNGMDVGDVDGDGTQEIVVLARFKKAIVYKWNQGRLQEMGEFKASAYDRLLWVCLVDANHDGKDEIYLSNLRNDRLSSYVLDWQAGKLVQLANRQRWYFNKVALPGKGDVLAGQKKSAENLFAPGVYHLQFAGGDYQPLESVKLPDKANVFNFAQADLDGDGLAETVLTGHGDRIHVMAQDGSRLWKSRDYYGATANLIPAKKQPLTQITSDQEEEAERYYIPSQLVVADLNRDGRPEILANRNVSFVARVLAKSRNFSDAEIQSLVWTGHELTPQWKTKPLRGMVVSYQLADVDGDGQDEIVAAVALEKELLARSASMIHVYELHQVSGPPGAG